MTVWRLQALQRIGAFHEGLAIDHVDTEYCLRARQAGLTLHVNGAFEFAHAIGERRKYRLLGVELQAGGHSPQRRHMIARNTVWLARNWFCREPAFSALCLVRLAYEAVGITHGRRSGRRQTHRLAAGRRQRPVRASRGRVTRRKPSQHP
jgi:rhamnosyltransferase